MDITLECIKKASQVNGEDPTEKQRQKAVPLKKTHQSYIIINDLSGIIMQYCLVLIRRPPKSEMSRAPRQVAQFWCASGVDAIRDNSSFSTSHAFKQLSCKHRGPCSHGNESNKSNESSEWSPEHLPLFLEQRKMTSQKKCQSLVWSSWTEDSGDWMYNIYICYIYVRVCNVYIYMYVIDNKYIYIYRYIYI